MDVFSTLPEAVISDIWEIGEMKRATVRGNEYSRIKLCDVIIDEGTYDNFNTTPSAEGQQNNVLIYAKPIDMPTLDTTKLTAGYFWHNTETNQFYEIREASIGKNQATGEIEHIECLVRQTKVVIGGKNE